jgi:hypothetical protein
MHAMEYTLEVNNNKRLGSNIAMETFNIITLLSILIRPLQEDELSWAQIVKKICTNTSFGHFYKK